MFTLRRLLATCVAMAILAGCSSEGDPVGPIGGDTTVTPPPPTPKVVAVKIDCPAEAVVSTTFFCTPIVVYDNNKEEVVPLDSVVWSAKQGNFYVLLGPKGSWTAQREGDEEVKAVWGNFFVATKVVQVKPFPAVSWDQWSWVPVFERDWIGQSNLLDGFATRFVGVINVWADPTVNARYSVINALKYWSDSLPGLVSFKIVSDSSDAQLKIFVDLGLTDPGICAEAGFVQLPYGKIERGIIRFNPMTSGCQYPGVLEHEVGHTIGVFAHTLPGVDVMSSSGIQPNLSDLVRNGLMWVLARPVPTRVVVPPTPILAGFRLGDEKPVYRVIVN